MDLKNFAAKILDDLKGSATEAWASWTDDEKALVKACAQDAALIAVRAATGEDVKAAKAEVDAQLRAIKVAVGYSASSAIWAIASKYLSIAAKLLLA